MSKKKRERIKQKEARHKAAANATEKGRQMESAAAAETKGSAPVSDRPNHAAVAAPADLPHLAGASPEWKNWYASVSEAFRKDRL